MSTGDDFTRLAPCRIWLDRGLVRVLDLGGLAPVEPHFGQTIRHQIEDLGRIPIDIQYDSWRPEGPPPIGGVFHVGRCGSTLLSQLLQVGMQRWVIREPPVTRDLSSRWASSMPQDAARIMEAWNRVGRGFGASAGNGVLIKYTSTEALFLPEILGTSRLRYVAMVREPLGVVQSELDSPPGWISDLYRHPDELTSRFPGVPGRLPTATPTAMDWYTALWCAIVASILESPLDRVLVVDYEDVVNDPLGVVRRVERYLGVSPAVADHDFYEESNEVISGYSKEGQLGRGRPFDPNGIHRRTPLSPRAAHAVSQRTEALWEAVSLRMSRGVTA